MRYYILRNYTVENLFAKLNARFSGYGDISQFDQNIDFYLWFYLLPIKARTDLVVAEIDDFAAKIEFLQQQLPSNKPSSVNIARRQLLSLLFPEWIKKIKRKF